MSQQGTTRRRFLQGSVATVAIAGAARVLPASAAPEPFRLTITEGDLTMVDGTPVFFRGFAGPDGGPPRLPGPPLGNPGPLPTNPEITEGELVRVSITNATPRDHTFLIERTAGEAASSPVVGPVRIPARTTTPVEIQFTAPAAGTYIYRDADRNNRLLGMNGVMIVLPRGARGENRPYAPAAGRLEIPAEVVVQFVWSVHCADPVLGELARQQFLESNISYPLASVLPRYFFINGHHGSEALHDPGTVPVLPLQDALGSQVGALIRCVNTGVAVHALHWHGNHIFVLQRNAVPARAGLVFEKDVLRLDPLQRIDVLLPAHTGLDAWPMLTPDHPKVAEQSFPMHCHAEMSQTAGGGLYPLGMVTDWKLSGTAFDARQTTQQLVEQSAAIRRSVPSRPAPRPAARRPRLQLDVTPSPKPARAGRRTRFSFRTTTRTGGRRRPVRGARVRFAGRVLRTGPGGRARTRVRFRRPRRAPALATRPGFQRARRIIRIGKKR
jgi:FtsP/CotA-like multicopper oxidase with cupredoxin domain